MIIRIFRENQLFIILLSFLISVLVWIRVGFYDQNIPDISGSFFSSAFFLLPILKSINNYQAISVLLNIALLIFSGNYLTRLCIKFQLIPIRTSLPMFILFMISMPYFSHYNGFSYPLATIPVLLLVIDLLFASAEDKGISFSYFDSALLLSFMSFFNFYIIFFVAFIFFILIQFKGLQWRELLFILFGILTPYLFLIAFLYLLDIDIQDWFSGFKALFTTKLPIILPVSFYAIIIFSGILFLVASFGIARNYVKMRTVIRKYAVVLFGLLILTFIILIYPVLKIDYLFFLAIPLSFLFSYYFATCRINLFNQVIFVLFLGINLTFLVFY